MGSCARLCFYHVSGGVRSKWKLENIAKPWEGRSKTRCAKKHKHRSKVNFGMDSEVFLWPVRSVFGPGGRSGSILFEVDLLCNKKVTRRTLSELGFGVVGPLNYPKRGPRPKSKDQKPKEQRNHRKGNRSRSRPGSPVADI